MNKYDYDLLEYAYNHLNTTHEYECEVSFKSSNDYVKYREAANALLTLGYIERSDGDTFMSSSYDPLSTFKYSITGKGIQYFRSELDKKI